MTLRPLLFALIVAAARKVSRARAIALVRGLSLLAAIATAEWLSPGSGAKFASGTSLLLFMPVFATLNCTTCVPTYSGRFQIDLSSLSNGDCTNCSALNGTYVVTLGSLSNSSSCGACLFYGLFTTSSLGPCSTFTCLSPFSFGWYVLPAFSSSMTYTATLVYEWGASYMSAFPCGPSHFSQWTISKGSDRDCSAISAATATAGGNFNLETANGCFTTSPTVAIVCRNTGSTLTLTAVP